MDYKREKNLVRERQTGVAPCLRKRIFSFISSGSVYSCRSQIEIRSLYKTEPISFEPEPPTISYPHHDSISAQPQPVWKAYSAKIRPRADGSVSMNLLTISTRLSTTNLKLFFTTKRADGMTAVGRIIITGVDAFRHAHTQF